MAQAAAAPTRAPSQRPRPAPRRKAKPAGRRGPQVRPGKLRRLPPASGKQSPTLPARKPKGPQMTIYRSHSPRVVAQNAAGLIPVAAGRTAVAVRELPDSGAIVRLTQGRLWIGVLGALLVGIVALNVVSLGLNAGSGRIGQQIDLLTQQNSALRADIAEKLSSTKVQNAAATLGLAVPGPTQITYVSYSPADLTRAAKELAGRIVPVVTSASTVQSSGASSSPATLSAQTTSSIAPSTPAPTTTSSPASSPTPPTAPSHSTPSPTSGGGVSPGL